MARRRLRSPERDEATFSQPFGDRLDVVSPAFDHQLRFPQASRQIPIDPVPKCPMVSSVLKIAASLDILDGFPGIAAHQARSFDRSTYRKAITEQCAAIARHETADMRYDGA